MTTATITIEQNDKTSMAEVIITVTKEDGAEVYASNWDTDTEQLEQALTEAAQEIQPQLERAAQ